MDDVNNEQAKPEVDAEKVMGFAMCMLCFVALGIGATVGSNIIHSVLGE
jgi:hypothetical protein